MASFLDVGCGPGVIKASISKSRAYVGLDVSEVYINKAKQLYGEWRILQMSATEIDKLTRSDFDLVILNGSFITYLITRSANF